MKDVRNTFAENLKVAMDKRGVSQQDLADYTGVSVATVSYWCNGKKYPRPNRMQMISDRLRVSMAWLTTGEESEYIRQYSKMIIEDDVADIAQQIKSLDDHGRNVVMSVLKLEMERMQNEKK